MSCNVKRKKEWHVATKTFYMYVVLIVFLSSDGWRERFRDEHPLRGRPADGLLLHWGRDIQGEGGPHRGPPPARLQHPVRSVWAWYRAPGGRNFGEISRSGAETQLFHMFRVLEFLIELKTWQSFTYYLPKKLRTQNVLFCRGNSQWPK